MSQSKRMCKSIYTKFENKQIQSVGRGVEGEGLPGTAEAVYFGAGYMSVNGL